MTIAAEKTIFWFASTLKFLRNLSGEVRSDIGHGLRRARRDGGGGLHRRTNGRRAEWRDTAEGKSEVAEVLDDRKQRQEALEKKEEEEKKNALKRK